MVDQKYTLYEYYRSSASWRVRLALNWKKLPYESKPINLLTQEQLRAEYRDINPTQKVPALITKDGKLLSQSEAILEYLEEAHPEHPILPKDPYERGVVREISQIVACDIHPLQNMGVLVRVGGDDMNKRTEWARSCIERGFNGLELRLKTTAGKCCVGDSVTMADFFVVSIVGNAERFGVDMTKFPIIARISKTLNELPAFKSAHPFSQPECPAELKYK
ncbi:glutathione S-transferase zeta 1 [Pilobolus umbonatus]|nr:glutathione S-transferase zeta 1 [Pilobolus umbonatus]